MLFPFYVDVMSTALAFSGKETRTSKYDLVYQEENKVCGNEISFD